MIYRYRDRDGRTFLYNESNSVKFFYGNFLGRAIIKFFSFPIFSKIVGFILNRGVSKLFVPRFVRKNNIDLSLYKNSIFKSFNDFFTRELKDENININKSNEVFVSPCDAKLSVYRIDDDSRFMIKDSYYSVSELLDGSAIYKKYLGGYALIFRLCADDYHRYIYLDNGSKEKNIFIPGKLNTVRPIVLKYENIYKRNAREYTVLHTENFGDVVQIEVGAVLVGKINNFHEEHKFVRGEEKGCFEFGGSTIVLLVEENKIVVDDDIIKNTSEGVETLVKCGMKIGKRFF